MRRSEPGIETDSTFRPDENTPSPYGSGGRLATTVRRLLDDPRNRTRITHVEDVPARHGRHADWPEWVPRLLVDRLALSGIERPWEHQVRAADLAHSGRSVILATGTASGKSLAYLMPAMEAAFDGDAVLYLSPTKALAADQLRALRALKLAQ